MSLFALKWFVFVLAMLNAGYMAFDGVHALTTGDYVRPSKGDYAGQLGPWARIVRLIGVDPEGRPMKAFFAIWGVAGVLCAMAFAGGLRGSLPALMAFNVFSLWYLVPGTISSAVQLGLLSFLWYVSRDA